jgi:PhnB protein
MAKVSTYLNFPRTTEAAFNFYKTVFGTEFFTPIGRFCDTFRRPGYPALVDTGRTCFDGYGCIRIQGV